MQSASVQIRDVCVCVCNNHIGMPQHLNSRFDHCKTMNKTRGKKIRQIFRTRSSTKTRKMRRDEKRFEKHTHSKSHWAMKKKTYLIGTRKARAMKQKRAKYNDEEIHTYRTANAKLLNYLCFKRTQSIWLMIVAVAAVWLCRCVATYQFFLFIVLLLLILPTTWYTSSRCRLI